MTTKFKIIFAGALFLIIALLLYFSFRVGYIEKEYTNSLIRTTNKIVQVYHKLEKKHGDRKINTDELSEYLRYITKKFQNIALLAISDDDLSIRLARKNDRFIKTAELYESILGDFTQEKFNIYKDNPFIVRYYDEKYNGEESQHKFYIFLNRIGTYKLLAVYPYKPGKKILARTVLEISLIVVFIIIVTASVYMLLNRHVRKEIERGFNAINLDLNKRTIEKEDIKISRDTSNVVSDTLSNHVYNLFEKIYTQYLPEVISLYIYDLADLLVKTFMLKGKTFIKIDSKNFDTIDIDNEVGNELKKSSVMILENGKKVILPLVYNNSFLGAVIIIKNLGLKGNEISDIKSRVKDILKNINDFLVVNDVMIDKRTGLNSEIYFKLKYNESLGLSQNRGKDFSIILISLFDEDLMLNDNEKNQIIKLLSPTISENIKDDDYICIFNDFLGVVLTDTNNNEAINTAKLILEMLKRFRIKISKDKVLQITPHIGISSTDSTEENKDILDIAVRNLENAILKEKGNISQKSLFNRRLTPIYADNTDK